MTTHIDAKAKWGTLLSCSLSCFIAWLDFAIVNTALPAIEQDLSATLLQLQWVMNGYILATCVLIVTLGRLSDHIGRRTMNIVGVSCFGLSSLLAGLASTPTLLILCRLLQGASTAAIIPTSLALISHAFPGAEKGKAIGIWSGVTGLGMALGPVLGGFLVSALSWRWIFFINVPFAIASIILSLYFAKESRVESGGMKPDYKGFALLTVGLTSLVFSLMHAPDWGWISFQTLALFAFSIAILIWFYRSETHSTSPTIPFSLFSSCAFSCSTMVMFCLVFVFTADLFLIPLYLIQVRMQEAYQAGLTILPITACIALFSLLVGPLLTKFSAKSLMIIGLLFFCLGIILQAFITADTSLAFLMPALISLGIGWGITRPPATTSALTSAPHHYAGTASGVLWTIQNCGGALSIAIVLTIFRKISQTAPTPEAFLSGYHTAMWLLSAVTFITILMLAYFLRSKPHHAS
jgi:EmrB/QacA subfamily drug resistance transporter